MVSEMVTEGKAACQTPRPPGRRFDRVAVVDYNSDLPGSAGDERGQSLLAEVIVSENENFESALKRFTKRVQQDGILAEARRREHFEKPSVRRKKKEAAKRRKSRK